jgi:hypothetical protein
MCKFVPGEVIAIAPFGDLHELIGRMPSRGRTRASELPGRLSVFPLIPEETGVNGASPLGELGIAVLQTEPGLELFGLSQLSARLAAGVVSGKAVVDLNHILPVASTAVGGIDAYRLSPPADELARAVRSVLRYEGPPILGTVAVLDSGLDPNLHLQRDHEYLDYSLDGRLLRGTALADPLGHGTRVVKILDEVLPPEVRLIVGRLPSEASRLTSLTLSQALGDVVARTAPDVVNLSVTTRDPVFVCPNCRGRVPVPSFICSALSLILRLSGKSQAGTWTIMAAGNDGQIPNSRWLDVDNTTLVLAVAENRHGHRTRYSGSPVGPDSDLFSASAFGGDDPDEAGAAGVFHDGGHGTSFAAPFVSAAALLAKRQIATREGPPTGPVGEHIRSVLASVRRESLRRRGLWMPEGAD